MALVPLLNFTKGAISPELQARIDTAQYGAGAKQLNNFIIQKYGGASFRPICHERNVSRVQGLRDFLIRP